MKCSKSLALGVIVIALALAANVASASVIDLAGKTTYTSGVVYDDPANFGAPYAFDGNTGTRWASDIGTLGDPDWILVDMGANYDISEIKIDWEYAVPGTYSLGVRTAAQGLSMNVATDYTTIASASRDQNVNGGGGSWDDTYDFTAGTASFVGTGSATLSASPVGQYLLLSGVRNIDGGSLISTFEIQVSGSLAPVPEPASIVLLAGGLIGLSAYAWRKRK